MSIGNIPSGFFDNPLTIKESDVLGLPQDLIKELGILSDVELRIIEIIDLAGGTVCLDKIIIGLFHMTGETHSRIKMTARLYRMAKKGLLFRVPRRKGIYTNKPLRTNHD